MNLGNTIVTRQITLCVYITGFLVFLAINFQVMSRFYPGQKGHSPGYIADNFGTKM